MPIKPRNRHVGKSCSRGKAAHDEAWCQSVIATALVALVRAASSLSVLGHEAADGLHRKSSRQDSSGLLRRRALRLVGVVDDCLSGEADHR